MGTTSFAYADMISRLIAATPKEDEDVVIAAVFEDDTQCFAIENANSLPIKFDDIQLATKQCPILRNAIELIKNGWPACRKHIASQEVSKFFDHRHGLILIDDCVFHGDRLIIPNELRNKTLDELHRGHHGYVKIKLLAQIMVFWPGINHYIERKVKSYENCAKVPRCPRLSPLAWPKPTNPWSRIHADYAGPVKGLYFLIIVDAFSNWPEIFKTISTSSLKTIALFKNAFASNGLCDTLVSDRYLQDRIEKARWQYRRENSRVLNNLSFNTISCIGRQGTMRIDE